MLQVISNNFIITQLGTPSKKKNGKKSDIVTLAFDPSPPLA